MIFIECRKHKQAGWWPALVFLMPPAALPLIFKTRKKKAGLLSAVVLLSFITCLGSEIFLYTSRAERKPDILPPIIKQMLVLNENIKKTTEDIYAASEKLDGISMVQSRITDVKTAIDLIGELRHRVDENQKAIEELLEFIEDHGEFVRRKNLAWVFAIKDFYLDHDVIQHHKSRDNYLASFETLLKYTHANFQNIMELKSRRHMKSYDVYYLRYRRAADSHNRFNKKRITFQSAYVKSHPEVSPFLPGAHQMGKFKFWDKFSF